MVFIPNPENKKEVNHINGHKDNNKIENLEWCSKSENEIHAHKTGLKAAIKGRKHKLSKQVMQYDIQDNLIKIWECQSEAERQLKINQASISSCCLGKRKRAGGYIWRYKD